MIDYKNPAEVRELLERVTDGPWVAIKDECWRVEPDIFNGGDKPGQGWYEPPTAEDAQFIALSREALPYWIERTEKAEKAVERLIMELQNAGACPPGMYVLCAGEGVDEGPCDKCRDCWTVWVLKEDSHVD